MKAAIQKSDGVFTPVLIAGGIILLVSFAIRASFGIFQIPIAAEFHWLRADFSFAIAIQNLFWGIGQPIFSAIAEKYGDRKAIILGVLFYVLGLVFSSYAVTAQQHQLLEMFVGFGIAGTGFGVILAIVGRAASNRHRSLALGIATAAGSAGQIVGPLMAELLLNYMTWQSVFLVFAVCVALTLLALPFIQAPAVMKKGQETAEEDAAGLGEVILRAGRDPNYICIFIGFFACGYQLAFITAHFPAFITEICAAVSPGSLIHSLGVTTTSALGAMSIAVIGVFNVGGTVLAGWLGNIYSRKYLLASVYALRTLVSAAFILTPMTPDTVILFSIIMGSLWLATVPLTSGLVAQIYGLKYMGTLYGFVFFSHQLGGFLGVWLGGYMYDLYGSYNLVWWVGVGVGALSAVIHLPINERPWAVNKAQEVA
ncbi:MAG: MFS transporter [Methylocystaceae bacterium]|nr:MFS transporter [Methylocystaceae bacterium]